MTLTDRIASLFGEIAVAAGVFEAQHGTKPRYVILPPADAAAITEYVKSSDAMFPTKPRLVGRTTRDMCRRMLVSDLEVKVWQLAVRPHVA